MIKPLMSHLCRIEATPKHAERAGRIRRAIEDFLEPPTDIRALLQLGYYDRLIALEILDDDAPADLHPYL